MTSSATPPHTLSAAPAGPAAPPAPETAPPNAPPTARPGPLLLGLLALFGAIALLLLAPGRMTVSTMEGDVLHLLDGVTRMRMGQWPHVDFATPLGALAYLPVSAWGDLGLGRAMALSHATAAAVCLPALVWIGLSRLRLGMALALGAVVLVTAATLAWSPDSQGATAAMSYNHWGWALVMQGLALMLLDRAGATARGATGREATGRGRAAVGGREAAHPVGGRAHDTDAGQPSSSMAALQGSQRTWGACEEGMGGSRGMVPKRLK